MRETGNVIKLHYGNARARRRQDEQGSLITQSAARRLPLSHRHVPKGRVSEPLSALLQKSFFFFFLKQQPISPPAPMLGLFLQLSWGASDNQDTLKHSLSECCNAFWTWRTGQVAVRLSPILETSPQSLVRNLGLVVPVKLKPCHLPSWL